MGKPGAGGERLSAAMGVCGLTGLARPTHL